MPYLVGDVSEKQGVFCETRDAFAARSVGAEPFTSFLAMKFYLVRNLTARARSRSTNTNVHMRPVMSP